MKINEVMAWSGSDGTDWIELYNAGDQAVDLSGARLMDEDDNVYVLPDGTSIPAQGFMTISQDQADAPGFSFGLSQDDGVTLSAADGTLLDELSWDRGDIPGYGSLGRFPDGSDTLRRYYVSSAGSANPDTADEDRLATVRARYPHYSASAADTSEALFDPERVPRFDLWLEDSALAYLDGAPTAERYVEGALLYEGQLVPAVGIRYKASGGGFIGCIAEEDHVNTYSVIEIPSGHKTCSKLSMKIKVDWQDDDDRFYGLKKLQFISQNKDPTLMHDRLGYWLFAEFGVPAPRSVHAEVYINGDYAGVFTLNEEVDAIFAARHFTDGSGNLYKEVWPVDYQGNPSSPARLASNLRTNEKDPTVARFAMFGQAVAGLPENAEQEHIEQVLSQWLDMDEILRYLVVDRAIAADDGIFHWYCFGPCMNHNYFWYENTANGRVHLIPWDLDGAFENLGEPKNPYTPIHDAWNEVSNDCEPIKYPPDPRAIEQFSMVTHRSAACDKLIGAFTAYEQKFDALMAQLHQQAYNSETINTLLDEWSAQIEPSVAQAAALHDDQPSVDVWQQAVAKLKADIAAHVN